MGFITTNSDGEFELNPVAKWLHDNHNNREIYDGEARELLECVNSSNDTDCKWVLDACVSYFKLKEFYRGWRDVTVTMRALEFGEGSNKLVGIIYVYVDNVKVIDIHERSVLLECITKSSDFQFSRGSYLDFKGLRLLFERDKGKTKVPIASWLDEDVDEFDRMRFFEALFCDDETSPTFDELFEDGSLLLSVQNKIEDWCCDSGCSLPSSYVGIISVLCRVVSMIAICDEEYPPVLSVLCNEGGIRINLKVDDIDTVDTASVMPLVAKLTSNIHFEWGIDGAASFENGFDLSFDIPVKWNYN